MIGVFLATMPSNEGNSPRSEILSSDDLHEIVRALPELYGARDMTDFPLASLRLINRLIPAAKFSSYNEIEMKTASARVFFEPAEFEEEGERYKPYIWKYRHQHPIMRLFEQGDHEGVRMISDFLQPEELHELELYQEVLAKMGLEDTLSITLPCTGNLKVFYAVNGPQRFTERDRTVAGVLQPHLVQAFENVQAFTDAKAMVALSSHAFQAGSHGLILADDSGRIIHASEIASDHLSILEPESEGAPMVLAANERLHPRLLDWLYEISPFADQRSRILEVESGGSRVLFRSAKVDEQHWVIATQKQTLRALATSLQEVYGLSERQAGVLFWISRGKSNADIAAILEISDRTVAKHIEHLFDKLGVENRLAATRKALDAIG